MTCPLYSVFHVVLSTQSLPACGETSHHTSLGAVALTAPRSLLRFTFRKRAAACARESATALPWAHPGRRFARPDSCWMTRHSENERSLGEINLALSGDRVI